jgi:hypothetical protein
MTQPFLFCYRTEQSKPANTGILSGFVYRHARDVIVHELTGMPAVRDCNVRPLVTKKADVEKGEDRKDTWL